MGFGLLTRPPETRDGVLILALCLQSQSQYVMGRGKLRLHLNDSARLLHGFVVLSSHIQIPGALDANDER